MQSLLILSIALSLSGAVLIAEPATALGALKLIPRGQAKYLARIEAREGTPFPERWHVLIHNKKAESGVHEYVIAGGEIVASRGLSQFAETLTAADVIGADAMKIDSDHGVKALQQYAVANNLAIATVNYELRKDGAEAVPLWHVTGLDDKGKEVGRVVLTANKGTVISHLGFDLEPNLTPDKAVVFEPQVTRQVSSAEPVPGEEASSRKEASDGNRTRRPGLLRRAGGSLQRLFTGRDTISR